MTESIDGNTNRSISVFSVASVANERDSARLCLKIMQILKD